jgi:cytochrome d ubiquinol oxidase subunit II
MAATISFWLVVVICLGMYVVLDGYDLGAGMLTLTERDGKTRRQLIEVVATAWDGNETWLILLAVTLFGGLPTAYGAALPALYVPVVVMLLALVFRGAAIERVSNSHAHSINDHRHRGSIRRHAPSVAPADRIGHCGNQTRPGCTSKG